MWTVIHMIPNGSKAKEIKEKLLSDGFLVKIQQKSKDDYFEIIVLESEAEEAYNRMIELGFS